MFKLRKDASMQNQKEEIWLSRKEAAEFAGTTAKSLSTGDCNKRHNLHPRKINGKIYYPKSILKEYRDRNLMPY